MKQTVINKHNKYGLHSNKVQSTVDREDIAKRIVACRCIVAKIVLI